MAAPAFVTARPALLVSMAITGVLGVLGITWGILVDSQMILLDGVQSVIGIAVALLVLVAGQLSDDRPTRSYPFGKHALTPFVIGIQGAVLTATLLYAGFESVISIRDGGSSVAAGPAMVYGIVVTLSSVATWRWLHQRSGRSDLLRAESTAWRIAALRGVAMVLGFAFALAVADTDWARVGPYIDPVMVLVTCVVFLPSTVAMVRATLVELFEGAPAPELQQHVLAAVTAGHAGFPIDEPRVRMTKTGKKLYVEIVADADPALTIGDQQLVYERVMAGIDPLPYDAWVTLELTPRHR